jgi:hypothetical protein
LLIWTAVIVFSVGTVGVIASLRDGPLSKASSSGSGAVEVLADGSLVFAPPSLQPTNTGVGSAQLRFRYQLSEHAGPPLLRSWVKKEEFTIEISSARNRADDSPIVIKPEAIKGVDSQVRMWVKSLGVGAPAQGLLTGRGTSQTTFDGRGIARWWLGLILWIGVPLVCWRAGERLFPPSRAELLRRGLCPECGYSLTGLAGSKCPECGGDLSPAELTALAAAKRS